MYRCMENMCTVCVFVHKCLCVCTLKLIGHWISPAASENKCSAVCIQSHKTDPQQR